MLHIRNISEEEHINLKKFIILKSEMCLNMVNYLAA